MSVDDCLKSNMIAICRKAEVFSSPRKKVKANLYISVNPKATQNGRGPNIALLVAPRARQPRISWKERVCVAWTSAVTWTTGNWIHIKLFYITNS